MGFDITYLRTARRIDEKEKEKKTSRHVLCF
jgi:hypothetical protein